MKRFFSPCQRYQKAIALSAARVLPEKEAADVQQHLASCENCRAFAKEIQRMTGSLTVWASELPEAKASARFEAEWMRAVKESPSPSRATLEAAKPSRSLGDFLLSFRWHLTGLSALWLLIAFLNSDTATAVAPQIAKQDKASSEQVVAALRENRRQIKELIDPATVAASAQDPSAPNLLFRRRSEIETPMAIV